MNYLRNFFAAGAMMIPVSAIPNVCGHEGHVHHDEIRVTVSPELQQRIQRLNTDPKHMVTAFRQQQPSALPTPAIAEYFEPFRNKVGLRWDDRYLYVESNGLPDHDMMTGITAWQQQVPLPQPFTGDNAWRIPLHPVPAEKPMSAKENFFIGAIAMAVNGVPIFNPIKTGGRVDTFLAGELDQWGGHCGKADDYHYHIAPVHLEKIVGKGNPIGVALDGYPIYGYDDPDGSKPSLDRLNGHRDADGNYHYHATKNYPYVNGGFFGQVNEVNGHVEPQARAQHLRGDARRPLRGAKITRFERSESHHFLVEYEVYGEEKQIEYTINKDGSADFRYTDASGTTEKTYEPGRRNRGTRPGNEGTSRSQDGMRKGGRPGPGRPRPEDGGRPRRRPPRNGRDRNGDNKISAEEQSAISRGGSHALSRDL